ncbi:3-hydroxyisobutyrate dehydrogenase [hydrothermal vent metagenome]|uniref:3-hydroxyisobutyrate dehydrogenase n=1 Tax=hydrothermal vent metagenome TaxID=652676 RepID=A0A3B0RP04_9ZZZZ
MSKIGFIGLGNMGGPMAANLVKAGHEVKGFDLVSENLENFVVAGGKAAGTVADAVGDAEIVISMLPAGKHVMAVYSGPEGVLENVADGALLIDCSTIDVTTAREIAEQAAASGFDMLDAPVSGGIMGAQGATLTFMTGASDQAFARAEPVLAQMGKNIIHAGGPGNGQAAKVCNNMLLGISMIGVSEAFNLADKLGLDRQKLFDISSTASGQCWSLTTYCPVPGPVATSPANNDYQPGFSVAMMLKDLKLSQDAASSAGVDTPLGAHATELYDAFETAGNGDVDFSGIIKHLRK